MAKQKYIDVLPSLTWKGSSFCGDTRGQALVMIRKGFQYVVCKCYINTNSYFVTTRRYLFGTCSLRTVHESSTIIIGPADK